MEIVYFELNDWFSGRDYPAEEPFIDWIKNRQFCNDKWVKENKLCVVWGPIDMSCNWCITAPKSWVEENCPQLLSDEGIDYTVQRSDSKGEWETIVEHRDFKDFLRFPGKNYDYEEDDDEEDEEDEYEKEPPIGRWGMPFKEYSEENFGATWYGVDEDEYYEEDDDE